MISTADIRDWLKSQNDLGALWSIGRLEAEKEKRVCIYQRDAGTGQTAALGGSQATKTYVKRIQVLIHWNKNYRETEEAAQTLYNLLRFNPRGTIGAQKFSYLDLLSEEPIDLGSDEHGIFERTILLDVYYEGE